MVLAAIPQISARWRARAGPAPTAAAAAAPPPLTGTVLPAATPVERLQALSQALESQAENTAHPRDLLTFAAFKEAVEILASDAVDLATLRQYALGRLWALSCAAFEALRVRPDRQAFLEAATAQWRTYSPGTLHFVLRYFSSLQTRPALGDPVTLAHDWWSNHAMLIESFREYFDARQALNDPLVFGPALLAAQVDLGAMERFLSLIDHPVALGLAAELKRWKAARIDERALSTFGRFWPPQPEEILVEPEPWRAALERAVEAVASERPRSVVVIGGPRIGKSGFLRLLGERLALEGWRVFEATAADLMADQIYFGQFEGRIRETVAELDAGKKVVWCVGDLQQLAQSGAHKSQAASILDQIWPAIAAGRLLVLAEADPDGASRTLQSRPSLRMLVELVRLSPFDDAEIRSFVDGVSRTLEARRGVLVTREAREAAMHYGLQYLRAADAPGVLADVLKRAGDRALAEADGTLAGLSPDQGRPVDADHVIQAISLMTGLPMDILDERDPIELSAIRRYFGERVIGQDEAVAVVVDRIAMLKAGLVDPHKPIGVFLFAGPTGTGKTELAKTLADFLFGSPDRLVRLDMSEFQAAETVSKIVGERGTGGAGDPLVERIRKQPFSVVLLDEFEKAHSNVWDLFLQVFDDGRLTDANGHTVDFRHTIIILTSNLGATSHRSSGMGFGQARDVFAEQQVIAAIERAFRPEFVNRLDRIVVFRPLTRAVLYQILRKELAAVLRRRGLRNREWAVEWEPSALDFLLERGFSPELGARPLKRAIDQYLLAPLAATLVEHRFPEGDQFLFVRGGAGALEVEFLDPNGEAGAESVGPEGDGDIELGGPTLAALVLKPRDSDAARHLLRRRQEALDETLASALWMDLKQTLTAAAADPEIWTHPGRSAVFSGLNLIDRVREAADTVSRLAARLPPAARADAGSAALIGRLALQLHLVEGGVADALEGAPADAIVRVDGSMEDGGAADEAAKAWARRVFAMYQGWAERRRMKLRVLAGDGGGAILAVSGFGAFRTLSAEAGLHVLEASGEDSARRLTARVRVCEEPSGDLSPPTYAHALRAIDASPRPQIIVRRYREHPAPLVRDTASGGRSGQLEPVLDGDFDLIFDRGA